MLATTARSRKARLSSSFGSGLRVQGCFARLSLPLAVATICCKWSDLDKGIVRPVGDRLKDRRTSLSTAIKLT